MDNLGFAFLLTFFAGGATLIGGLIALFVKNTNKAFLSGSLGFSAGVMIYVSLVEIFPEAQKSLQHFFTEPIAFAWANIAFFMGIIFIAVIDKLVPGFENPHEFRDLENTHFSQTDLNKIRLLRVGVMVALVISIHNFPEGLATFFTSLQNPQIGMAIAFAVAIHNIPEGISVSVPIYYATKSRKKAFFYAAVSGFAEPLGALMGYFFLFKFFNELAVGLTLAAVAGIMVFISIDQLLPAAREYGKHHHSIYGFVLGMGIMALSLAII